MPAFLLHQENVSDPSDSCTRSHTTLQTQQTHCECVSAGLWSEVVFVLWFCVTDSFRLPEELHINEAACGKPLNHGFVAHLHTFITLFAVMLSWQEAANHAHFYRQTEHKHTVQHSPNSYSVFLSVSGIELVHTEGSWASKEGMFQDIIHSCLGILSRLIVI